MADFTSWGPLPDYTLKPDVSVPGVDIISTGNDNISYKRAVEKLNKKLVEEVGSERTLGRPINIIEEKIM